MPELPEVELHARSLRSWLRGRSVERLEVLDPLLWGEHLRPTTVARQIQGKVERIGRLGKYLLLELEGNQTLVVHLRMTGKLIHHQYVTESAPRHTRFLLHLDDGSAVRFQDVRRFGRVWSAPTTEIRSLPELSRLGPDALDEPISAEKLAVSTACMKRSIKTHLMDQTILAGLGNICAIEILFRCRIDPARPVRSLTDTDIVRLAGDIPPYLEWAIHAQSHRELLYIGEPGAENVFSLYARRGEPCPACASPIERTVLAGRGTYWCPACQH